MRLAEGNSAAASAFYLATLQLDNRHRGALNNLGVMALDDGKFDAAENWLRRAEDVDPGNAKIHFLLAKTLLAKNEAELAREEIEIAIRLRPNQIEFQQLKQKIKDYERYEAARPFGMELSRPPCPAEDIVAPLEKSASTLTTAVSRSGGKRTAFWVAIAALLAAAVKGAIAWNTIGTNDVVTFYQFGRSLQDHGLEWTYVHDISFNHPPLTAYFFIGIYNLAHLPFLQENTISFPFLLRLPGIVADLVTVWAVFQIGKSVDWKVRRGRYSCSPSARPH